MTTFEGTFAISVFLKKKPNIWSFHLKNIKEHPESSVASRLGCFFLARRQIIGYFPEMFAVDHELDGGRK